MRRVLVTGATGFVGRQALAPLLARDFEVHSVGRSVSDTPHVTHHVCDLFDAQSTAALVSSIQPTHLLHLAWYAAPRLYWTSDENLRWVEASLALARQFRANGGQRIVCAGSCAEYDWAHGHCAETTTPLRPSTLYGTSKLALSSILSAWGQLHELRVAWGRLFFLYGPHEHPDRLVSSVIRSLLERDEAKCSAGTQIRDFQHVRDAAGALVALLDSTVTGPVNIASGHALPVRDLVLHIADFLDARSLVSLGALPIASGDPAILTADVSRLRTEVGWTDTFDLAAGLHDTIRWWKQ